MTGMDELIAFLRAQLDEDERTARAASELCGCCPAAPSWRFADDEAGGRIVTVDDPHPAIRRQLGRRWNRSYGDMFTARHVARWDPARVLAEIDAKRRVLNWCERLDGDNQERSEHARLVASWLGQPYAGRDGWDPRWAA